MEQRLLRFQTIAWIQGTLLLAFIESVLFLQKTWDAGELRYFGLGLLAIVLVLNGLMHVYMKRAREALLRDLSGGVRL